MLPQLPDVLGLDVGGANLKAAYSCRAVRLRRFALWKNPAALPDALRDLLGGMPDADLLAVTMTGELCDCFATKREGVHAILDAVEQVAGSVPVRVWLNDGRLVPLAAARAEPLRAAAANWLALATFAGRLAPIGPALLLDIGSTTADIVPLLDGQPVPRGRTDPERLDCGELVYTGVRRTPLCALLGSTGAAEFFATTQDAYLLLGDLPEDAADQDTADGRPATREAAHARLARMRCADRETFGEGETLVLARRVRATQIVLLRSAVERVARTLPGPPTTVVIAGSGEFLARAVLEEMTHWPIRLRSLAQDLGPAVSQAACAYALAVLAAEQLHV
jgi:probable H4MPT-linked C1 transfer pathway protein